MEGFPCEISGLMGMRSRSFWVFMGLALWETGGADDLDCIRFRWASSVVGGDEVGEAGGEFWIRITHMMGEIDN